MSPSKRLEPIRRFAENNQRTAARELGKSQRELNLQQQKLEELRNYHRQYMAQYEAAGRQGLNSAQLQEYQAFLAKLTTAIKQQEAVVEASRSDRVRKQAVWQQKYSRTNALDKAVDRFKKREHKEREAREQKDSDERGQRNRQDS